MVNLMTKSMQSSFTHYLHFTRTQWAALLKTIPITLSRVNRLNLKDIIHNFPWKEVRDIYLPLSYLIDFYISLYLSRQAILGRFSGTYEHKIPYVIGITGSVAAGKTTTAMLLQVVLSLWPKPRTVDIVTTDGFLQPNQVLKDKNLMHKKGFPESYDITSLVNFILKVKSGAPHAAVPVYSHVNYDIVPFSYQVVSQPDILILEGLNILSGGTDNKNELCQIFVSDFIDFSIYIDASTKVLKDWYLNRFLKFRCNAFNNPDSYFNHYTKISDQEAVIIATKIWTEINELNLKENIIPMRERSDLILRKTNNHKVDKIRLRK